MTTTTDRPAASPASSRGPFLTFLGRPSSGVVMLLVLAALTINAAVDISYVFIDPRLHPGGDR